MVQPIRIAYQGEPGAFSEEAVLAYFGEDADSTAVPTWRAVFEAVHRDRAEAGVVAIESSAGGSVRETYDLLGEYFDHGVRILGEVSVPVRLVLVALPGQSVDEMERIYSHTQALAQADEFLRGRPWQVMTTYNTAGAARMIAEGGERRAGAIASPRVADLYGLEVLAENVQTGNDNRTRFAVIALQGGSVGVRRQPPDKPMKTTLVFAVRNVPGSLHRCLGAFAARDVNLSRLESRPSRATRWEYVFWVDLDADAADPVCAAAIADLRAEAQMVRVLGSYPRGAD
jgi:prephenate dehydratase/chorismate mutase/prephenate dehydratase